MASLSLALLSVLSLMLLFPSALISVAVLGFLAVLGIIFGILQLTRRSSARALAYSGIILLLLVLSVSSLMVYMILSPPTYVKILQDMGYDRSIVDNPIPVESFSAVDTPSARWAYSGVVAIPFGWYNDHQQEKIRIETPLIGKDPTQPISFDPGDSTFGFFIIDKLGSGGKYYTESAKNGGESHVKVFPSIVDGREIPNSYLLCWEDYPLSLGPSTLIDFTDLIVRVDGAKPVPPDDAHRREGDRQ